MRSFDNVLNDKPTNLVALLGKGRILYARRNYSQALQTFQLVLRMNPMCQPDPRIGIGLCYWAMGNKSKAKAAWERSMEVVSYIAWCFARSLLFVRIPTNGPPSSYLVWKALTTAKTMISLNKNGSDYTRLE